MRLCQAKSARGPAPSLYCTTKADFRTSGPAPHGVGALVA